jgi:hypothetical protein
MSKWPDRQQDWTKPRLDQPSLNYTPSEADTSYAGSMGKWSRLDEDDDKSRVSTYSYRSERDASRFGRQVEGRAGLLQVVNVFTRLWRLIDHKCPNRSVLSAYWCV